MDLGRSDPYYRGSFVAYPFSWFEASYQYTDVNNALYSDIQAFSGKQTYKDKSFDAKFLIFKEKELLPAIAIGARDMAGTGMFSSEYIVGSKRLGNIDFTMGLGWGRSLEMATTLLLEFLEINSNFVKKIPTPWEVNST